LVTWIVCYFCIFKGVRSIGPTIKLIVFVPYIVLAVLLIYNARLEDSEEGVKAYIGEWDLSALKSGEAWSDAAGQIFFSLSLAQGTPSPLLLSLAALYPVASTSMHAMRGS
jgi:SNF family Na+-dependent transporter